MYFSFPSHDPDGAVPDEIATQVNEYAASYEFTLGNVGGGRTPKDPLEKEAFSIAKGYLAGKIKESGSTVKEYTSTDEGKEKYNQLVAQIAANEKVVAEAEKRVAARSEAPDLKIKI